MKWNTDSTCNFELPPEGTSWSHKKNKLQKGVILVWTIFSVSFNLFEGSKANTLKKYISKSIINRQLRQIEKVGNLDSI